VECRYFMKFEWSYFGSACCCSHMVGHAGSLTGIVHADVILTQSKVKVTGLLNFRKLPKPCMLAAMTFSALARLSGLFLLLVLLFLFFLCFMCIVVQFK